MTAGLSDRMRSVLFRIREGRPVSAYDCQTSIRTMESLERRGLVTSTHDVESIFYPAVNIKWTITPAGRELLARDEGREDSSCT